MSDIRPLDVADVDDADATLARAFAADPMFDWVFPRSERRVADHTRLNRVAVRYGTRFGRVTTSGSARAVAVWIPPGHHVGPANMIRCGVLGVPLGIGLGSFARFMRAVAVMEKMQQEHVPEPRWHLLVLGVDPTLQGRGLGGALVREGLDRADAEKQVAYLETSEERNLGFYQRLGFVVVAEGRLAEGGPPVWAMRRGQRAA